MKTAAKIYLMTMMGMVVIPTVSAKAQMLGDAAAGVGAMAQEQAQVQAQAGAVQSQAQDQIQAQAQMQAQSAPTSLATVPVQTATTRTDAAPASSSHSKPDMGTALPGADLTIDDQGGDDKAIKVPKSVKTLIKHLDQSTDNITLDDLNSAREAVARLDVLVDIEKRLSDLATIRREREEKNGTSSNVPALPASAIAAPGFQQMQPPAFPSPYPPMGGGASGGFNGGAPALPPISASSAEPEIERIVGANGHYYASIKGSDEKSHRYREGDKLPDGGVIQSISSKGVTVLKDKTSHTYTVKDAGTVFSGR